MINEKKRFEHRKGRTRLKLRKVGRDLARLSVFRSNKHIYAQVIDDLSGRTVAFASTNEKSLRDEIANGGNAESAARIGALIAERSLAAGVDRVIFDRGGYIFHGRVKAMADAARTSGLKF